jgi:hypothetical protein
VIERTACICGSCRRARQIRDDERRLGIQAPPLPATVGVGGREQLMMTVARGRWLYREAAGWTQAEIAQHLNDHDLRTPCNQRPWTQASVSYWLRFGPTAPAKAA